MSARAFTLALALVNASLAHAAPPTPGPPVSAKPTHSGVKPNAPPSSSVAKAPELGAVLAQLAKIEALDAKFREEKRMALLATPLTSEGALYYQKPRMLARHTQKPHASSVLLRGEQLSFGDERHSESMELSSQPALRVLVDTFVSVLGGDLAALEKVAALSIEPLPNDGYRIRVSPKDDKVKRLVRAMSFEGQGATLTRMELLDANGDTTVTSFSSVVLRKPFTPAEQKRLFRIGG